MSDFHSLSVSSVTHLTPNAVAISFTIPSNLKDEFSFVAGQYITIKHYLNGGEVRRAYSISSVPTANEITIGIKKVEGGTFSVFANSGIKAGDVLEVSAPEGKFTFLPQNKAQHIAAFAAGSGITPIMSIAQTVLASHLNASFVLVYGNQKPEEAMFLETIKDLEQKYSGRFFVKYVYSRSREADCLFGRIDATSVNYILKNKFKDTAFDAFYLCGPEEMIHNVSDALKATSIPEDKIHYELFTSSETVDTLAENLDGDTQVEVIVDDESYTFAMDKKVLILDAALKENIDAPYSCQGGVCSTCIARVTEGKAEMVKNQILTDSEIAEGLILTCQAHPLTPTLKVDFDDV